MTLLHNLVIGFCSFVNSHELVIEELDPNEPNTLLDYFDRWIMASKIIEECAGNRERALVVFALAAAWYFDRPDDWQGVEGITSPSHYQDNLCMSKLLDGDTWDQVLFERKYGRDEA